MNWTTPPPLEMTPLEVCRVIASLSAGWDEDGSTGPREPYRWETVARMALDLARSVVEGATPATASREGVWRCKHCGALNNDGSTWRWDGHIWEHYCEGEFKQHPQAGPAGAERIS